MENRENCNGDEIKKKKERKGEEGQIDRSVSYHKYIYKKKKKKNVTAKIQSWDISIRYKSDKFGRLCRVSAT